jgi:hypothetical protein
VNITWNKVLWFAAGVAVGAAATNHFFKTKYERLYQEDVESVKRAFSMPQQSEPVEGSTKDEVASEPDSEEVETYNEIISTQGYQTVTGSPEESIGEEVKGVRRPYVISPVEFDTEDDYEVYTLTYYADGVLVDEQGNPIENVEDMVGRDSLNHFGEYEEDAVHVRNEAMQCDFEILRDLDRYSDVFRNGPRPDDDE